GLDRVLRHGRARLRQLLALPRADCAPGRSAVAAQRLTDAVIVVPSATVSVTPRSAPGAKRWSTTRPSALPPSAKRQRHARRLPSPPRARPRKRQVPAPIWVASI